MLTLLFGSTAVGAGVLTIIIGIVGAFIAGIL